MRFHQSLLMRLLNFILISKLKNKLYYSLFILILNALNKIIVLRNTKKTKYFNRLLIISIKINFPIISRELKYNNIII